MKENSTWDNFMDKENLTMPMETHMRVIGSMGNNLVKGKLNMQMAQSMKACLKREKRVVKGYIDIKMVVYIPVLGKKICHLD